ncbi:MAG: hypothetical protein CMH27_07305 [Micavibrio sp.]|nr:hypothetical protein [Micavibrio sp.]
MLDQDITPLNADDLPAIDALQAAAHVPELHEPRALFAAMIDYPHSICLGIRGGQGLRGYILGYASRAERADFTTGPEDSFDPGVLYLHDLCIAIEEQGAGLGKILYDAFETRARRAGYTRLIANAIEGRLTFWENQGFTAGAQTTYHGVTATRIEKTLSPAAANNTEKKDIAI